MLLITGVADSKEPCLVVDYGTNAEMALICGDGRIITGSAAAGPATAEVTPGTTAHGMPRARSARLTGLM